MNTLRIFLFGGLVILVFAACIDSTGPAGKHGPAEVFFDFRITGEEGNDSVTVLMQFRYQGEYGPTVAIDPPGTVILDGKIIEPDNSNITGPLYVVTREIKKFTGKHSIVVTGADSKKFREDFIFKPFSLRTKIPDTITRKRLDLNFNGLDPEDYVRIMLTDTTFTGEGVNRLDTVVNNMTSITRSDLFSLDPGPVQLELTREYEKETESSGRYGGNIAVLYTIRREFFLRD